MALFTKEDFMELDVPNLVINIWNFSNHEKCEQCFLYMNYNINALKEKWSEQYIDFDFLINVLNKRDKNFYDFVKVWGDEKNIIYKIIQK